MGKAVRAMTSRKVKAVLKPVLSVSNHYGKCQLCGAETSWLVNNKFVCPSCCKANGWAKDIPDGCEVCSIQGEWACGTDGQHSLCHVHRDMWLCWDRRNTLLEGWEKLPESEKEALWEKCFNAFVNEMRGELKICPFCGQTMKEKGGNSNEE